MVSMVAFYRLHTGTGRSCLGGHLGDDLGVVLRVIPARTLRLQWRATGQGFGFNWANWLPGNLQLANLLAAFGDDYAASVVVFILWIGADCIRT